MKWPTILKTIGKKHINQNSGEKSGKRKREKTEREIPFEGGHV
jgi:hypothetical protein